MLAPTPSVRYRHGRPDRLSEAEPVPDSKGAAVSAVDWHGTMLLFLYTGADHSILCRTVRGREVGPAMDLGIKSTIAPGPAVDTVHNQLLLGTAAPSGGQRYRWQLRRLEWDIASASFRESSCAFVGGEKSGWAGSRRPTLLFISDSEYGPEDKLYWIATGVSDPETRPTSTYLAQTIGYKDVNEGWLRWRYYD